MALDPRLDQISRITPAGGTMTRLADLERRLRIAELALAAGSPPIGSGGAYYGAGDPPGGNWLANDGRALNRTVYAELFAVIGTTFGAGDGTTTFNLPTDTGTAIRAR